MKKVILTAAIVFTVGVLSLLTATSTSKNTSVKPAKVAINDTFVLATAD